MIATELPTEEGFRQRGHQVARLETFVDAALAFSLSLLVIVQDELPQTVADLRAALHRIPTFVACFALIALFWASHNRWSRRFGLSDSKSTVLSLAFVLVVLVYVYPLRMVASAGLATLTGGWVPSEIGQLDRNWLLDIQTVFIVYSIGFGLLASLLWLLNTHALKWSLTAAPLPLSPIERFDVQSEIGMHRIMAISAMASVVLSAALLLSGPEAGLAALVSAPMWVYAVMGAVLPWYWKRRNRRRMHLETEGHG